MRHKRVWFFPSGITEVLKTSLQNADVFSPTSPIIFGRTKDRVHQEAWVKVLAWARSLKLVYLQWV